MADAGFPGFNTLVSTLQNVVTAINALTQQVKATFPQTTGTATTATAGTSGAPPSQVAGYAEVVINGSTVKIPYYN